ncbi:MAG TPA: hypothetical protein VGI88_08775, partial [Verrucomicrobiae bacterium]
SHPVFIGACHAIVLKGTQSRSDIVYLALNDRLDVKWKPKKITIKFARSNLCCRASYHGL